MTMTRLFSIAAAGLLALVSWWFIAINDDRRPTEPAPSDAPPVSVSTPQAVMTNRETIDSEYNLITWVTHLKRAKASDLVPMIQSEWPGKVLCSADDVTNSLQVTSQPAVMEAIQVAVIKLDKPGSKAKLKPVASRRTTLIGGAADAAGDVEAVEKIGNATIIRMTHPDIEGVVVDELRAKFGTRAIIYFGPRLDSISVDAEPLVVEEVRAAAKAMEPKVTGNPFATMMGGGGAQEGSVNGPRVASNPQTDVQEAALDREARQLATKLRTAKLDEQAALRRQLEQLTERHFDQRQERRQREIDDLAHRVDVLRVTHQRRGQNRATVIQQRVQDLLDPNADLRWDELQTNEDSRTNASRRVGTAHQGDAGGNPFGGAEKRVGSAHPTTTTATPTAASSVEPTFDGTAYSQWLKMLDTERKPEKLAAAMDACSRLASPADVPRIVRSIIAAAEPFETAETSERMNVLSAGCRGLGQLLNSDTAHGTDFVFAEVQSRIDNGSFIGTHGVVCLFLSALGSPESLVNTDAPIPSLQVHAAPIIAALLRHHAALKQFDPRLADAATGVWMLSQAPIDDFEGLRPFVMKGFESRIVANGRYWPWRSLKSREYAVQLPEIVTILTEQFDKQPDVLVRDLGTLGPLAEPAVPKLVARLVTVWKSREEIDRATASGRGSPDSERDGTWHSQMGFVFDALQKIGPKAKAAVPILKELLSICPADQDGDNVRQHRHWMKSAINDTLHVIGDTADVGGPETPPQLSDFSHLTAIWKLTSSQPGQTIEGIRMSVGRVVMFSGKQQVKAEIIGLIGCGTNPRSYVIDESTTPKQITLVEEDRKDFQQFGIYELKGDRLKIEFAQPGLARPTEFATDPEKLPEGHVLLEFERDR